MSWISKLERKFGRYAIHNLMLYLIGCYILGFVIMYVNPVFYYRYLALDPAAIMRGQIWRIVTFLIQPPSTSLLYFLLYLYLYYILGNALERVWGAFTFNLYIFIGILGHILGAMVVYWVSGYNGAPYYYDLHYLYMSLFLAFALTFPETEFLLFFLIPIKAKWFALVDLLYFAYAIITGSISTRIVAILALLNFLLFAATFYKSKVQSTARRMSFQSKVKAGERESRNRAPGGARHRCAVCGRTELDDPTLEFRFCSQCDGMYEYCSEHLYTHRHVKKNTSAQNPEQ